MKFGFQCGMRPKSRLAGIGCMLRMNDNRHEHCGRGDAGRDGGMGGEQSTHRLCRPGQRGHLRFHREDSEGAAVPPSEQRAERDRETIPGEGHWPKSSTNDAADSVLDGSAADRAKTGAPSELSHAVYRGRHCLVTVTAL